MKKQLYHFTMEQLVKIWGLGRDGIHFGSNRDSGIVRTLKTNEILNTPVERIELMLDKLLTGYNERKGPQIIELKIDALFRDRDEFNKFSHLPYFSKDWPYTLYLEKKPNGL